MKKVTRLKWKQFKSQSRRRHAKLIERLCDAECGHILDKAQDIMERSGYDKARKHFDRYEKCSRSCYIRRSETGYSRASKRWAKYGR